MKIVRPYLESSFIIGEFKDTFGERCTLQYSSTNSNIWLGVHENRMHLDRPMAAMLVPYLKAFAETGDYMSVDPAEVDNARQFKMLDDFSKALRNAGGELEAEWPQLAEVLYELASPVGVE